MTISSDDKTILLIWVFLAIFHVEYKIYYNMCELIEIQ